MEEIITPEVEAVNVDQIDVFDGWESEESVNADQHEAEEAEERTGEETPEETPKEEPAQEAKEDQFLTLKHFDEVRNVTREEATELAQKGMDYDRVKGQVEELRSFKNEYQPVVDLVKSYADRNDMTIPEYLDFCRIQDIKAEKGVSDDEAKSILSLEKREKAVAEKEAEQAKVAEESKPVEVTEEERVRREVQEFTTVYPNVKADEIPKEVFELVTKEHITLTVAYGKWRIAQQEKELASLRAQDNARKKSPGSLSNSLTTPKRDPIFDGWDD